MRDLRPLSTQDKRRRRADIPTTEVVPGANSWESGRVAQTTLEERPVAGHDGGARSSA